MISLVEYFQFMGFNYAAGGRCCNYPLNCSKALQPQKKTYQNANLRQKETIAWGFLLRSYGIPKEPYTKVHLLSSMKCQACCNTALQGGYFFAPGFNTPAQVTGLISGSVARYFYKGSKRSLQKLIPVSNLEIMCLGFTYILYFEVSQKGTFSEIFIISLYDR